MVAPSVNETMLTAIQEGFGTHSYTSGTGTTGTTTPPNTGDAAGDRLRFVLDVLDFIWVQEIGFGTYCRQWDCQAADIERRVFILLSNGLCKHHIARLAVGLGMSRRRRFARRGRNRRAVTTGNVKNLVLMIRWKDSPYQPRTPTTPGLPTVQVWRRNCQGRAVYD
jgi:hypothetical protein